MTAAITSLYALPLAAIYLVLWFNVTRTRSAMNLSIGDAGDSTLLRRIRCHGNFVEWVPMVLILMLLAELQGADAVYIHASGALLVLGRLAHPIGLKVDNASHPLRIIGNATNILATVSAMICLAVKGLGF